MCLKSRGDVARVRGHLPCSCWTSARSPGGQYVRQPGGLTPASVEAPDVGPGLIKRCRPDRPPSLKDLDFCPLAEAPDYAGLKIARRSAYTSLRSRRTFRGRSPRKPCVFDRARATALVASIARPRMVTSAEHATDRAFCGAPMTWVNRTRSPPCAFLGL